MYTLYPNILKARARLRSHLEVTVFWTMLDALQFWGGILILITLQVVFDVYMILTFTCSCLQILTSATLFTSLVLDATSLQCPH